MLTLITCILSLLIHSSDGFLSITVNARSFIPLKQSTASSSTEDLLKPTYEVEPIPIRIGHGFDIHRMAPIQEAGQPIVIGGVEITHKNQKVRYVHDCSSIHFFV